MTEHPVVMERVLAVVAEALESYRPHLIAQAQSASTLGLRNARHVDNFLSQTDLELHSFYREQLSSLFDGILYVSEEDNPELLGTSQLNALDTIALVDPLDTSELAVRGLHGYTHVLLCEASTGRGLLAVVGDFFHYDRLYFAYRDRTDVLRAYVRSIDGSERALRASTEENLGQSVVTAYSMRPIERFVPLAQHRRFLNELASSSGAASGRGRIGVDFGSIGLCHVASGATDAMIEIAKGFRLWDLAPGHFVLNAAGGVVTDLEGKVLPLGVRPAREIIADPRDDPRRRFIAAGTRGLAAGLLAALHE